MCIQLSRNDCIIQLIEWFFRLVVTCWSRHAGMVVSFIKGLRVVPGMPEWLCHVCRRRWFLYRVAPVMAGGVSCELCRMLVDVGLIEWM
jgi:hypothetical protein